MAAELRSLTVDIDTGRWRDTVLTNVDLRVPDGQITALLGGPGDGKTMIAYALTGRLPASARATGEVLVDGSVGYIPQDGVDAFDPHRPVGEQLRSIAAPARAMPVDRACAAAYYPREVMDLLPKQHSAGQIQRAAVAAALRAAPDVLIADSPTASLDQGTAQAVWQSLRAYADTGAAVLVITHDLPLLTTTGHADTLAIMTRGRIRATGPLPALMATEDPLIRRYFQASCH
ncbi:ATP-binding cassette domain-containing protein [Nocardia asteroides]|uniref:ATP-binding cassette domain-containing protein n=1 Tax=Nocardia asteroides TaxID=1824 RepID=UPI001E4FBE6F|nr:ATP-binding cassette domain-containing protein [Nocardia asteroides]UGT58230.1 ATP-binding cassette domain-containing protein [Nocardia asteroides]